MQQYKEKNAVAILTFNRSETTKKLMEIMKIIKPPRLYVIIDGPRDSHKGEKEKVDIVKQIIDDNVDWECELYKNYSEKNMGTCMRQYTGFSWVFEKEEQAIILEDDCIPNLDFFRYCDEMLEKYKDDERVMMVSGSNYLKKWESGYSYHFSSMGGIWGWATWRRAWLKYDVDIRAWCSASTVRSRRSIRMQPSPLLPPSLRSRPSTISWARKWASAWSLAAGILSRPSLWQRPT